MNIKYKGIIYLIICIVSFSSCDDYLDVAPDQNLDEEKVFTDFANAERFHNDIYANLEHRFNAVGDWLPVPLACASDEAEGTNGSYNLNMGVYEGIDDNTSKWYEGIRKANLFLSKVDVVPFPTESRKNQMLGEAYFLRAFYFNEVVKRFGGMPIMTEENILMPSDNLSLPRNTYKECVDRMLEDLENAINLLPTTLEETEYGKATKGAAMALKARILLFAASPLWQNEMGENLWARAAEAAKAVIDLKDNSGNLVYELYNTGNGADDYENLFFNRREHRNKEVIFHKHAAPVGFNSDQISVWAPKGGGLGGSGSVCPTQNFVDLFETATGKLTTDSDTDYNPQNPYVNRDPRFYKTVLYNGAEWQGEILQLFYSEDESQSGEHRKNKADYTSTGYYVRKYLPESVKFNTTVTAYHNWIYFRLAEMYLNYAEALNESLPAPSSEVYNALNEVRRRSGHVDMPTGLSKDQMRERIWNERAIELSFEEHRWWDARRWLKAVDWFNGSMFEMEITKEGNNFVYNKKVYTSRVFRSYMNLYPIPTSEMQKNALYYQNPGW